MNEIGSTLLAVVLFIVFLVAYFGPAAWAIGDAQKRGRSGCLILFLFWLFGPLSAGVWLAVRPRARVVDRSPTEYTDPDDALAAADRLDHLGEWDAAIALYQSTAQRWPEHSDYVDSCIKSIRQKQSL